MPKKITTLYMYNDLSTAIYPNVVDENIPDTIMRVDDLGTELSKLTEYTFLAPVTIGASGKEQSFYLYGSATVSGALDVEGKATFGGDAEVKGTLQINSASDLVIKDGTTFAEADYDALKNYVNILYSNYFEGKFSGAMIVFGSGEFEADILLNGYQPLINTGACTNFTDCFAYAKITSRAQPSPSKVTLVDFPILSTPMNFTGMFDCYGYERWNGDDNSCEVVLGNGYGDTWFMFSSSSALAGKGVTAVSVAEGKTFQPYHCAAMFYSNFGITSITGIDFSRSTTMASVFQFCKGLKTLDCTGIHLSFDISASTRFEESDLVTIINNLETVSAAQTLTMGSTNLAKLTQDEILVATGKGWTLA